MATFQITVNEKTVKGRKFVEFIKTLDYIKVDESPYNPDFVKEIHKSRASKGKVIGFMELIYKTVIIRKYNNHEIWRIKNNLAT